MTRAQRIGLFVTATAIVVAGLFLPVDEDYNRRRYGNRYYWFIDTADEYHVDLSHLVVLWLGILIVGGLLWFAAKEQ